MRKYAIPKAVYVLLIAILLSLSIGYTYAYFSNIATAKSDVELGMIKVVWTDYNHGSTPIKGLYDNNATQDVDESMSIAITGELKRGNFVQIKTDPTDEEGIKLEMSNIDGTVGAFCRIKIDASYKRDDSTEYVECPDGWIQLALKIGNKEVLITDINWDDHEMNGWFYHNGYYYYGTKTTSVETGTTIALTEVSAYGGQVVADYIYLDENAGSVIFGSSVKIILTLESIQTTNNAYVSVWTQLGAQ